MTASLSAVFNVQEFTDAGLPAAGYRLYTYTAGTTTLKTAYTDAAASVAHTYTSDGLGGSYIALNSRGELPASLYLVSGIYDLCLKTPGGVTVWTRSAYGSNDIVNTLSSGLADTASVGNGDALIGVKSELSGATARTQHGKNADTLSIADFGATSASSAAANKAALQAAISAVHASGKPGVIIVNSDCAYGYKVEDKATWPSFAGITQPLLVIDYSLGADYGSYPTTYDGTQSRQFFHTPQTTGTVTFTAGLSSSSTSATLTGNWGKNTGPWAVTFSNGDVRYVTFTSGATTATWTGGLSSGATASASFVNPGMHDGNTAWHRGAWAPNYCLSNDMDLTGGRTTTDNRRARLTTFINGEAAWSLGQGSLDSATATDEELGNFTLEWRRRVADTIGGTADGYFNFIWERKTGNLGFGAGTNAPQFSYHFRSITTGFKQFCAESLTTTSEAVLRNSNGSGDDVSVKNTSGDLALNISSQGDALTVSKANRRVTISQAFVQKRVIVTYSASITIDASLGNFFTIAATNGTAFALNAPTNPADDQIIYIKLSNTSGGALGAITPNAVFKLVGGAWPSPATGNNITITLSYDGANWFELSRSGTVPN